MQSSRKTFIGGNWKSNNTLEKSKQIVENIVNRLTFNPDHTEVLIAPIDLHIPLVKSLIMNATIVASQNLSKYGFGAYTGETSADHLIDAGILWAILGHSERRNLPEIKETDEYIAEKAALAISKNLSIVYCIGELLEQRESDQTFQVLEKQLTALLTKLKPEDWTKIVIAYEPVWAIGTGKTASPQQAQDVHAYIRKWLLVNISEFMASSVRIIYGGSVTKDNCKELISQVDVDGFLVGGASLKEDFITIVESAQVVPK